MNSTVLRISVTAASLLLAAMHELTPGFTLSTTAVILLVVAALPWLQPLIKSVELLGVKVELQELRDQVTEVKGEAAEAKKKAIFATKPASPSTISIPPDAGTTLDTLAEQYDQTRNSPSGDTRTLAMTAIVHKIIATVPSSPHFNIQEALLEKRRRGIRLVAYVILYSAPSNDFLQALIESVTTLEDKPFGQYWGLQAIEKVIESVLRSTKAVSPQIVAQLREFGTRIPQGTDRYYKLEQIFASLRKKLA